MQLVTCSSPDSLKDFQTPLFTPWILSAHLAIGSEWAQFGEVESLKCLLSPKRIEGHRTKFKQFTNIYSALDVSWFDETR